MDLNHILTKDLVAEQVQSSTSEMDTFPYILPDTCVNILFDHLPLEDLLHCNLVCRKWNQLYRAACSRRRKRTLIISNPEDKNPYQSVANSAFSSHPFDNWDDKLSPIRHSWLMRMHSRLDDSLVNGLMRNFANITSLEIILTHIPFEKVDHMIELLHFWAEKLVSLKFWPSFKFQRSNFALMKSIDLRLMDAINSLTRLSHLTLSHHSDSLYMKDSNNEPIMRIQLENLKEFNLSNSSNPDNACKAIQSYAQLHPNLRVGFDLWFHKIEHVELLFSYRTIKWPHESLKE